MNVTAKVTRPGAFDTGLYAALTLGALLQGWHVLDQVAAAAKTAVPFLQADHAALGIASALLLWLGVTNRHLDAVNIRAASAIGALAGSMFFFTWIGFDLLNPTNIKWLLFGDWAQHYSAWAMYRTAPWTWPPGLIQTLWYPVGTAIVHTDALPLLAFAFKPFARILPTDFQYIGLWLLTSCILLGLFAALLIRRWSPRATPILCGSLLFLLAPIFLGRFFHDTLTAQWLLLAGLWLYFRTDSQPTWIREACPWWLLATIAALVHPYLSAMFLAILFAHWFKRAKVDHIFGSRQAICVVAIAIALTLTAWWLSGAFTIRFKDGGGQLAYGVHSFNLLGFLIPQGFSRIVPNIPLADPGQWEGQAYLGLGVLILIALLACEAILHGRKLVWPKQHWPLLAIACALLVYAASTTLTIGPWKLTDIQSKSPLLATFRASGRFIWVAYYLIMLATVTATLVRFPKIGTIFLALAVLCETWEFAPMHLHFAQLRTGIGWAAPEKMLTDPSWDVIARARHHLTMFPPAPCGVQAGPYLPFQLFAARHGMTFNSGYLARWNLRATQRYCEQLLRDSDAHYFKGDDVYIVDRSWESKMDKVSGIQCRALDGYRACVLAKDNSGN
ncbi:MAG TPA: DUF6311 domain-containing protein [Rudaea sp.]|nr:DUF6311 domain-containing protein [Rudaea sp.]